MKSKTVTCILLLMLAIPVRATAQTSYTVVKLAGNGGTQGQANSINNRGWAAGIGNVAGDASGEATLWFNGSRTPLGFLGGPNSGVFWPAKSNRGIVAGIAETPDINPLGQEMELLGIFSNRDLSHMRWLRLAERCDDGTSHFGWLQRLRYRGQQPRSNRGLG